jgi:hypothetical protein
MLDRLKSPFLVPPHWSGADTPKTGGNPGRFQPAHKFPQLGEPSRRLDGIDYCFVRRTSKILPGALGSFAERVGSGLSDHVPQTARARRFGCGKRPGEPPKGSLRTSPLTVRSLRLT